MFDHERSLVNDMKEAGEPFALIGVNVNDDLESIQEAVKDRGLNWRSFFCGDDPSVVEDYDVAAFPTVVIIDAEGIVRSVDHQVPDDVIHALLAEMK